MLNIRQKKVSVDLFRFSLVIVENLGNTMNLLNMQNDSVR